MWISTLQMALYFDQIKKEFLLKYVYHTSTKIDSFFPGIKFK